MIVALRLLRSIFWNGAVNPGLIDQEREREGEASGLPLLSCSLSLSFSLTHSLPGSRESAETAFDIKFPPTGSTFGEICTAGANKDMEMLAHRIFYPPNLEKVPAIVHGRTYEETAIQAFTARTGKEVSPCGIFIDPRSHLSLMK